MSNQPAGQDDRASHANASSRHFAGIRSRWRSILQDPAQSSMKAPAVEDAPQSPPFQVDQLLPEDPVVLRDLGGYQVLLRAIRWQRDNYLVGPEFADWRAKERERQEQDPGLLTNDPAYRLPHDEAAMGNQQLVKLASWFVPSVTVKTALLPLVVALPNGVLYELSRNAAATLISGQQENLNQVAKSQMLRLLENENIRESIKKSTRGYIRRSYRNNTQRPEAG